MIPGGCINKLGIYAQLIARTLNAALKNILYTKFFSNLLNRFFPISESEAGQPSNDRNIWYFRNGCSLFRVGSRLIDLPYK